MTVFPPRPAFSRLTSTRPRLVGPEALARFLVSGRPLRTGAGGKQIAFLAGEPRSKEKDEWRDKGFNQEIYEEDWRPTKVWLAAADGRDPVAVDADTTQPSKRDDVLFRVRILHRRE